MYTRIMFWSKWFLLSITRWLIRGGKYIQGKWSAFWQDIRRLTRRGIQSVLSFPALSLILISIGITFYSHHNEISSFGQRGGCEAHPLKMWVYGPAFLAPGDKLRFKISLYNSSEKPIEWVEVGITPTPPTAFWFPDGNVLRMEHITGYSFWNGEIEVQIFSFTSLDNIQVSTFLRQPGSTIFCGEIPLHFSEWRRKWLLFQALPGWLDLVLKILGVVSTVLVALITLFRKWGDFFDLLDKWTQK